MTWHRALGRRLLAGLASFCLLAPTAFAATNPPSMNDIPPRPQREMRGAWIATVANLNWPFKPGLPPEEQRRELVAIMDRAVQLKLNVLILQVRPACDALYSSKLEPWSEFLTGKMGQAPSPFYDPLSFAVTEAHRRGLELHAWFNPFRVRAPNPKTGAASNYMTRARPSWVRKHGSQLWLDPGLKAVQEHTMRVILDVVKRYDIDGVHLDDYFYPYPEKGANGKLLEFPDQFAWRGYVAAGGKLSRADWRRRNIDTFVSTLYKRVKAEKRWVKVGISPFGIWRLGAPAEVKKGLDAYEYLYTDSRKWLAHGWVDYFAPQLYWAVQGDQSYPALLHWWGAQNERSRILCPGNDLTKVGNVWTSAEILKQLRLTRDHPQATGNILWNVTSLMRNADRLADKVGREFYSQAALVPPMPWVKHPVPGKPTVQLRQSNPSKRWQVSWSLPKDGSAPAWLWLYQTRTNGRWETHVLPGSRDSWDLPAKSSPSFPELVAITPVNRCGATGPTALLRKPL